MLIHGRGLLFGAVLLLAGCRNHNTFFPVPLRAAHPDRRVEAVYLDRFGDLYPNQADIVDGERLRDGDGLRDYFRVARAEQSADWKLLLKEAGISGAEAGHANFDTLWSAIQTKLLAATRARVTGLAEDSSRTVVVLVHGFNNTKAQALANYDSIRRLVEIRTDSAKVRYLDVFWDGMNKAWVPIGVWGEAQYNFPLVGVRLRPVLSALPRTAKVRILTHSTGGPLIATALGPTHTAFDARTQNRDWPRDPNYRDHLAHDTASKGPLAPPELSDARVAMIIPAASANLFDGMPSAATFSRLIIGYSPRDYSVRKGWIARCSWFGATCLGTRRKDICGTAAKSLASVQGLDVRIVRLTNGTKGVWVGGDHSWLGYLARPGGQRALDLLLLSDSDSGNRVEDICGSS